MTFLNSRYRLPSDLTPRELDRLGRLTTLYGVRALSIEDGYLSVEYDASRVREAEVLAAIRNTGIPVEPLEPIPPGALDYTGEVRDFAWPTTGLSPVNQKLK
jgi:hypothetical protein